jgi:hypothetical protein
VGRERRAHAASAACRRGVWAAWVESSEGIYTNKLSLRIKQCLAFSTQCCAVGNLQKKPPTFFFPFSYAIVRTTKPKSSRKKSVGKSAGKTNAHAAYYMTQQAFAEHSAWIRAIRKRELRSRAWTDKVGSRRSPRLRCANMVVTNFYHSPQLVVRQNASVLV